MRGISVDEPDMVQPSLVRGSPALRPLAGMLLHGIRLRRALTTVGAALFFVVVGGLVGEGIQWREVFRAGTAAGAGGGACGGWVPP